VKFRKSSLVGSVQKISQNNFFMFEQRRGCASVIVHDLGVYTAAGMGLVSCLEPPQP
jgi:hypothetical protein